MVEFAYAQAAQGATGPGPLMTMFPFIIILVIMYFMVFRPQQKKQKEHRAMLEALRRGDRIVTGGGFFGTISKVTSPEEVEVDLAPNVRVRVLRATISSVLSKPDPAAAREAAKERDRDAVKEKEPARREADKVRPICAPDNDRPVFVIR